MQQYRFAPCTVGAVIFTMTFPSWMSWLEFMVLTRDGHGLQGLRSVFPIGKVIQFAFPIVFVALVERHRLRASRPTTRGLGLGLVFAGIVAAGMFLLYFGLLKQTEVLGEAPGKIRAWLEKIGCDTPTGFVLIASFVAIPHSLLEEYYWRWFVFGELRRMLPLPGAIALSSLAFMGHHVIVLAYYFPGQFWIAAVPFSLCVAVGGAAWAWLYHRSDNLIAPWFSHLLVDVAIMIVGYDLVFGSP